MSTLDIFFERGEKKGFEKGRMEGEMHGRLEGVMEGSDKTLLRNTKNMLAKGFDQNIICEVLEVTPDFVEKVRLELNV